jgi:transposase InsO family protein
MGDERSDRYHSRRGCIADGAGSSSPSAGPIHHSDRGSQYASHAYRDLFKENDMVCSMSGKGEYLDNNAHEITNLMPSTTLSGCG